MERMNGNVRARSGQGISPFFAYMRAVTCRFSERLADFDSGTLSRKFELESIVFTKFSPTSEFTVQPVRSR